MSPTSIALVLVMLASISPAVAETSTVHGHDTYWMHDDGTISITTDYVQQPSFRELNPTRKILSDLCRIPDTVPCPQGQLCVSQCAVSTRPIGAECQCGNDTGNVVKR